MEIAVHIPIMFGFVTFGGKSNEVFMVSGTKIHLPFPGLIPLLS